MSMSKYQVATETRSQNVQVNVGVHDSGMIETKIVDVRVTPHDNWTNEMIDLEHDFEMAKVLVRSWMRGIKPADEVKTLFAVIDKRIDDIATACEGTVYLNTNEAAVITALKEAIARVDEAWEIGMNVVERGQ